MPGFETRLLIDGEQVAGGAAWRPGAATLERSDRIEAGR
jgi:hypothetical protein